MHTFVSRAGNKLQAALEAIKIDVNGLICADFGSSTGGFVDCLLQNGASRVYSVDTAYGELAWKLRENEAQVVVMERTNALHVILPQKVDLITIDVGWTRQKMILPNAFANLKNGGTIISLIKPHYEAYKGFLRKGRLMDEKLEEVLSYTRQDISEAGGEIKGWIESPIVGDKAANKEYLALLKKNNA